MNKPKILYVEDDLNLGFVVKDTLEDAGYDVRLCTDGETATQQFGGDTFHLAILDVMLPKKDGFEIAEFIKKIQPDLPIIFLTAKEQADDKIKGLRLGADDYITKPFSTEEFLLRVENLLRRSSREIQAEEGMANTFRLGDFSFEFDNYRLVHNGSDIKSLTERESKLLRVLCQQANQVITREVLLQSVWGKDDYFTGRSMDVFISKLRKYLSADERIKIQVIHGVGFKLQIPE